jgi:hypothetical protein
MAGALPAMCIAAVPFFAVTQCSSDAIRYQGALLALVTGVAIAGLWQLPAIGTLSAPVVTLLRIAAVAGLAFLPVPSWQPPSDPVTLEHRLVVETIGRLAPGTLVIVPAGRFEQARVIPEFPDFLLPAAVGIAFDGDARIADHRGTRLIYLGLACISWSGDIDANGLRPECRALASGAAPWAVRTLRDEDLPRTADGAVWTFHRLATGTPFGFFQSTTPASAP